MLASRRGATNRPGGLAHRCGDARPQRGRSAVPIRRSVTAGGSGRSAGRLPAGQWFYGEDACSRSLQQGPVVLARVRRGLPAVVHHLIAAEGEPLEPAVGIAREAQLLQIVALQAGPSAPAAVRD